jgi:hypothetical protein
MAGHAELVLGDMFEGPSDLMVLPCSTAGTITDFVKQRLKMFNLPYPKAHMNLGSVDIVSPKESQQLAAYIAYAVSVKGFHSTLDAIRNISEKLGEFAQANPSVRQISAPLLGTGAGGLESSDVVQQLVRGFTATAPDTAVLKIFVLDKNVYAQLRDNEKLSRAELSRQEPNRVQDSASDDNDVPRIRVFVSYTRSDNKHAQWVKELAAFLRNNGIDARIDIWHLSPGMDLAQWMCNEVDIADRVLVICNEEYARRADGRHGGVGWETRLLQGYLLQNGASNPRKFIPIIRTPNHHEALPSFLKTAYFIHWPESSVDNADRQRLLLETLYDVQEQAPALGRPPSFVLQAMRRREK